MDGEILYIVLSGSLCSNRNKFYITAKRQQRSSLCFEQVGKAFAVLVIIEYLTTPVPQTRLSEEEYLLS